jgi:hypothetical protein
MAYWYFQFSDDATQSVYNMMRSIIRQLSTSPLPTAINRLWKDHKMPGSDPGMNELAKALDEVIDSLGGEVFIVMDALDEYPQPEREELLQVVLGLFHNHGENLHILVTSRPEHDIHSKLKSYPAMDIGTFVQNDVTQFVRNALQSGPLKVWSDNIKREIEERLLSTEER